MNNPNNSKRIFKPAVVVSFLAALAVLLAACAPSAPPAQNPSPTQSASTPTIAVGIAVVDVATDPKLGKYLVDDKGMTLYVFTKDAPDQTNCSGACLANWPLLDTSAAPKAGPGVDASLLGTTTLASGAMMVTYNHMPLYYFIKDTRPGQVSGEDVGSVWYVESPGGKPIEAPASSSPAATPAASGPTATPAAMPTEPTLNIASDSTHGKYLVDGNGMALYVFTKDGPDQSNCTGSCLVNWPPLLTQGSPIVSQGVDASLVGSAVLADGTHIVTYNHMPLYYFKKDSKPGDTLGQGLGSVWFLVSPGGKLVGQ